MSASEANFTVDAGGLRLLYRPSQLRLRKSRSANFVHDKAPTIAKTQASLPPRLVKGVGHFVASGDVNKFVTLGSETMPRPALRCFAKSANPKKRDVQV